MAGAIHAAQAPGRGGGVPAARVGGSACVRRCGGLCPRHEHHRLRHARRSLEAAGFGQEQAEAITNAVRDAVTESAATKADLTEVKTELKAEFAEVRAEFKAEIAEVRAEFKAEIAEVKAEIGRLDAKITDVKADIARLSARIDALMLRFAVFGVGLVGIAIAAIKLL